MRIKWIWLLTIALLFSACGHNKKDKNSQDANDLKPNSTKIDDIDKKVGYYRDSAIVGVDYQCGVWDGKTDVYGRFYFQSGKGCLFSLAGIVLREVSANDLLTNPIVIEDDKNVARMLQILDNDGNATVNLNITDSVANELKESNIKKVPSTEKEFERLYDIAKLDSGYSGKFKTQEEANEHLQEQIKDKTPPIITLNGDENITLTIGQNYEELGASAFDNVDGNISERIKISGNVDSTKEGYYIITYTVSDKAGNSTTLQKGIKILDNTHKFGCSADIISESKFTDTFIQNRIEDIALHTKIITRLPNNEIYLYSPESDVDKIAVMFNLARKHDPTIDINITMPSQEKWDTFSEGQKMLYLINKERCDRGIRAFEGVSTRLSREASQAFAEYMSQTNKFGHSVDGKGPGARFKEAGVISSGRDRNRDYSAPYGENIAYFGDFKEDANYERPLTIAKSVYLWLYEDKKLNYGHRSTILEGGAIENSGYKGIEGLIGVGKDTSKVINEYGVYRITTYIVLDIFDPMVNWENNLSDVIRVELTE